jgi:hypothetical protein
MVEAKRILTKRRPSLRPVISKTEASGRSKKKRVRVVASAKSLIGKRTV